MFGIFKKKTKDKTQSRATPRPEKVESIPDDIHAEISRLSQRGDQKAEAGQYGEALKEYEAAWELIPEPKGKWNAATWVLTAMGDAAYLSGDLDHALDAFSSAVKGPDGLGNPFIHLRLGQINFDLKNRDRAADELMRAYMGAGKDIFEEDDPKYFEFLKSRAKIDD